MTFCEEHKAMNQDIKDIKQGVEKIRDNHLRHLNYKLNIILWVVSVAFATIAILTGIIAQGMTR
jgi:hypothetical protein